ncbi:hypothetical protein EI94DRAFT_1747048 [Lactarius quietus]|nr:hypothetical protein EI94DRAFT_1747048 [Lactarius quietus]
MAARVKDDDDDVNGGDEDRVGLRSLYFTILRNTSHDWVCTLRNHVLYDIPDTLNLAQFLLDPTHSRSEPVSLSKVTYQLPIARLLGFLACLAGAVIFFLNHLVRVRLTPKHSQLFIGFGTNAPTHMSMTLSRSSLPAGEATWRPSSSVRMFDI